MIWGIFPRFLDFGGSFLDFWFVLERFLESTWSHFGGSESWLKLIWGIFPRFLDLGGLLDFRGNFWILDLFGKVFWIRIVTFWGVRKLKKIDWRPLFLSLGLFDGMVTESVTEWVSQSVSRITTWDASASKNPLALAKQKYKKAWYSSPCCE